MGVIRNGLGMTILIVMVISELVYNAIFHPVRSYRLWAYKKSWYQ